VKPPTVDRKLKVALAIAGNEAAGGGGPSYWTNRRCGHKNQCWQWGATENSLRPSNWRYDTAQDRGSLL